MIPVARFRRWQAFGTLALAAFVLSVIVGTVRVRGTEAQLQVVRDSLSVATAAIKAAEAQLVVVRAARQAALDSARVEQVLRDSLYRVAAARRDEARHWREVVETLSLASTVDSMPPLEQVRVLRAENTRLRAAGENTAVALVLANRTIDDLRASDLRQRQTAADANARAVAAEAALAAQLATARGAIRASLEAARRPWWKRAGTAIKDRAKDVGTFAAGVVVGRHT